MIIIWFWRCVVCVCVCVFLFQLSSVHFVICEHTMSNILTIKMRRFIWYERKIGVRMTDRGRERERARQKMRKEKPVSCKRIEPFSCCWKWKQQNLFNSCLSLSFSLFNLNHALHMYTLYLSIRRVQRSICGSNDTIYERVHTIEWRFIHCRFVTS